MKPDPLASSSTTPSTILSLRSSRLVGGVLVGRAVLGLGAAAAAAAAAPAARLRRLLGVGLGLGLGLGGLGLGLGLLGGGAVAVARLAGDDGVDQVIAAQAAIAVDPELVGQQVKVGERALLQLGAVKYGRHVRPLP